MRHSHPRILIRAGTVALVAVCLWFLCRPTQAVAAPLGQDQPPEGSGVTVITGPLVMPPDGSPLDTVVLLLDAGRLLTDTTPHWASVDSQIMGHIHPVAAQATTSLTSTQTVTDAAGATWAYSLALPQRPPGLSQTASGEPVPLRVYRLAAGPNLTGSPYLEFLEQAAAQSSLQIDPARNVVQAGTLLLYADAAGLTFPENVGEDGRLFTADDELMTVPVGYPLATVADGRVTLDRSPSVTMALHPSVDSGSARQWDLRDADLVTAVDALFEQLSIRYAYSDRQGLDWSELRSRYMPRIEQAATPGSNGDGQDAAAEDAAAEDAAAEDVAGNETESDDAPSDDPGNEPGDASQAAPDPAERAQSDEIDLGDIYRTLYTLAQELDDHHVRVAAGPEAPPAVNQAQAEAGGQSLGNLGITPVQLEDGRVIVAETAPGTAADNAEVRAGTEILTVDGVPVADALADVAYHGFPGTPTAGRLQQVEDLLRYPVGANVELEIRTPGSERIRAVTLTAGQFPVRRSFSVAGQPAPASYRFIDTYGYISWPGFDRARATLAVLEDFLHQAEIRASDGVIIDLRGNPGGDEILATTMASLFYDAQAPLTMDGSTVWRYDEEAGAFAPDAASTPAVHAPADRAYTGLVTVLVDEGCSGACERFVALLQENGRAAIVGQYPTAGGAGVVEEFVLPGDIRFTFPTTRRLDAAGELVIHGQGIQPDVRVPVVAEIELAKSNGEDPVADAAVAYMDAIQLQPVPVTFDHVGVTSVGPRSWRYDEETRQLRHRSGSSLTIIPQQSDDVAAAVAGFVGNLEGEAAPVETIEIGSDSAVRQWAIYEATLFGRPAWLAGTVEAEDTLLVGLFIANPDQAELLYNQVLMPFLENFSLGGDE